MAEFYRISDLPAASSLVGDELVEISQVSTTIRRSATTISAQASDNSYNDSGAGFVSAGFTVGDRVRVTGFTGNLANNILAGRITALTSTKMTIGGTDGDVIVDDAAGETVTIEKWTTRRALLSEIGIGAGSSSYDMRFGFTSSPTSSEVIDSVQIVRDLTIPANMVGSIGKVGVNPTATFIMELKDDGVVIGSISVSTSGVVTFSTTSGTEKVVVTGSELTLVAPVSVDATIENFSMTLLADENV
jgi:hypothetical protein